MTTSMTIDQAIQLAREHQASGRLAEAESIYRQILAANPNHAEALHLLGVLAHQAGRSSVAEELIRRAISINSNEAIYHSNLGNALLSQGKDEAALASHRRAAELAPQLAEIQNNLGFALGKSGNLQEAISAYRRAVQLRPDVMEIQINLANALKSAHRLDEAVADCPAVLKSNPDFATECYVSLSAALLARGKSDEAINAARRALNLKPNSAGAYTNLGAAHKDQGEMDKAIAAYRRAVELAPDDPLHHSALIFAMQYDPAYDAAAIQTEQRRFNDRHAQPLARFIQPHHNDRNPDRRLRVGYVGSEFCNHCLSFFTLPLLSNHDRSQFETFIYANVAKPDAMTQRLQTDADHWHDIAGVADVQVAQQIREDQIDILVDISLHLARNRLLVFAHKPAPVQVTWLGYPGSTGLEAMDYRISDLHLDPPGVNDEFYSEKTLRLPDSFWCYDPHSDRPGPNQLPAFSGAPITFGCLNNFCKVNEPMLQLWARIMREVPGSRLLLLADFGSHWQRTTAKLASMGIDPSRVEFAPKRPREQYLELFHRIDLMLDTFPYNGHTTSLDSFWMGVPVVTLLGQPAVSRAGLCLATNLGLEDLVAQNAEDYVRLATELARDLPRLSEFRQGLRNRMKASALMDGPRFARNMEASYRDMWRTCCSV